MLLQQRDQDESGKAPTLIHWSVKAQLAMRVGVYFSIPAANQG